MRAKYILVLIPVILVLLLFVARLYYFGPHSQSRRKEELLASLKLTDASLLFLVQRPNATRFEPYTVELYRLYKDGKADTCHVGDEESYWWFGGLKMRDDKSVKVTSMGITECIYDVATGVLRWTDKSYPPLTEKQSDYLFISNKVARLGYRF